MRSHLLCSYASERSRPEKIDRWISDLMRYREVCAGDPAKERTVEILLRKARSWNAPRASVQ